MTAGSPNEAAEEPVHPRRTPFPSQVQAGTERGGRVGSPGWAPPCEGGKAWERPYWEILAQVLGSGRALDSLSVREFPFLSGHSKPLWLRQVLARAGKSEPPAGLARQPGLAGPLPCKKTLPTDALPASPHGIAHHQLPASPGCWQKQNFTGVPISETCCKNW